MSIVRNFNLYLNAGNGSAPYINVNQYDQGEQWVFTLYKEDGTKYTPSTGAIVGIKADNRGIINTGTVDADGRVVINETQQMTAAAGIAIFELLIDGDTHGTANFLVNVEQRPGDNADLSDSDLSLIQEAVNAASEIEGLLDGQDVPTAITPIISDWLDDNITNPSNPPIDTSLTVAGAAADAKATGDEITDLKKQIDTLPYHSNIFAAAKGGAISAYPTRVKIPDKTAITVDTIVSLKPLSETTFGTNYMASYVVYDEDKTTVIKTSDGWKLANTLADFSIGKGQYLSLTTKFYPVESDTSQEGAVDLIKEAVEFYSASISGEIVKITDSVNEISNDFPHIKNALFGINTNIQGYIVQYGTYNYKTGISGTCADGTTTFDSTTILLTISNPINIIRRAYNGLATKSQLFTLDDICTDVGSNRYTIIDGIKYIVLAGNKSLCFDPINFAFSITSYAQNINDLVCLVDQKARQIDGGMLAPKIYYDMLSASDSLIQASISNLSDIVEAISTDFYTFPSEQIIVNRDLQNNSSLMFLWASDTHHQVHGSSVYGTTSKQIAEMSQVAEQAKVNFVLVTGDVVNGYYPVAEQKANLVNFVNKIRSHFNKPVFLTEGNHDDNSWYASARGSSGTEPTGFAQVLQTDDFTNYSMTNSIDFVHFDAENPLGGYYYYDFPKSKVRCICLNCEDIPYIENPDLTLKYYGQWTMGYSQKQLQWLASEALMFDEQGWGVILCQHNDSNMTGNTQEVKNLTNLNDIVNAFIAKSSGTTTSSTEDFEASVTYDFTGNASNDVIAWFSGHIHQDNVEIIDGVPHITIINTFNATGGGYDIVTIDRTNKKIFTKRYNNGALPAFNREISYGI